MYWSLPNCYYFTVFVAVHRVETRLYIYIYIYIYINQPDTKMLMTFYKKKKVVYHDYDKYKVWTLLFWV